jgi:diaminopimelate decarboxylase
MNEFDKKFIDSLVQEYGSPLFIISGEALRRNIRRFKSSFSIKYPKTEIAYSYKANCLSGLLEIIHNEGAWAEVASGFEYEMARTLGVIGSSIVFNGPYKKKGELKRAFKEGAILNVDHIDELKLLEEIATELRRTLEVGIRINLDVGIHQLPDRFGFNLESGEAIGVVARCVKKKLVRVIGLHIHLTSYIIEPEESENFVPAKRIKLIWPKGSNVYRIAAERVVRFAGEIREQFGINIKYIDMGGGFPSIDSLTAYVEAIVKPIINGFRHELPILILEPGRAIVRDAVQLITTVVGVKESPNGEKGVIVDAGISLLPTSFWRWQDIEPSTKVEDNLRDTTVYGPLCLQTDIIAKARLPEIKAGDKLVIKNVGAYNISQSSSFIFPRPYVLLIEKDSARVLRRAETVDDIFKFETL